MSVQSPKLPDITSRRKSKSKRGGADSPEIGMKKKAAEIHGPSSKADKNLESSAVNQLHKKELTRRRLHAEEQKQQAEQLEKQRQEEEEQLRSDLVSHRILVEEKDQTIGTLQQQIAELRQLCLTLSADKKKLEGEVETLGSKLEVAGQAQEEADEDLKLLKKNLAELTEKSTTKDDELERLSTALSKHVQKTLFDNRTSRNDINEEEKTLTTLVHAMEIKLSSILDALAKEEQKSKQDNIHTLENFNKKLDQYSEKYLNMLLQTKEKARSLPDILMLGRMGHTMHTHLSQEMKQQLREFSKDELLILLDCLSFEDGVLNFLKVELPHRKEHLMGEYTV